MPGVGVLTGRLEPRLESYALLRRPRAGEVGVVLVLLHLLQERRGVRDRAGAQPLGPVDEQRGLLAGRHLERVDVVARDPRDVVVHRLRGQLDGRRGHRGGDLRHGDRGLRDAARLVVGEDDTGGEAPGAVVHDPDGEAEVLGVARGLEDAVARPEVLVPVALEPEVGVARAELLGPGQRHVTEPTVWQVAEGRVEPWRTHASEPTGRPIRGSARCGCRCGRGAPGAGWGSGSGARGRG